jgi:hypothetical protein
MRLHNVTAVNCVTNNIVLTCPMREAPTAEDRERMPEMFDDEEKCVWRGERGGKGKLSFLLCLECELNYLLWYLE